MLYDYRCPKCKKTYEFKMNLKALEKGEKPKCPKCKILLTRVFTPVFIDPKATPTRSIGGIFE